MKTLALILSFLISQNQVDASVDSSVKNLLSGTELSVEFVSWPASSATSLCQNDPFSIQNDKDIVTSVGFLLTFGCPSNVPWFVIPVVIGKSVERITFTRTRSDIIKKLDEIIQPCFVYGYSASTVPTVLPHFRIVTTSLNALPRSVLSRNVIVALAVDRVRFDIALFGETPAGNLPPEITRIHFGEPTTITLTFEAPLITCPWGFSNNG